MPTLHWIGKDKVVKHHHEVPFKTLRREYVHTAPEGAPSNSTGNRIIHGDNLEALKALLPEFEGRVKCIYIDPPYNTGNEGWVYNDNVNDPRIQKWLHQVVGKEGEDLSRHDKWLCMMYPRLKLLHRLLAEDGVLLVSIDENEHLYLGLMLEEIFGSINKIETFIWKKSYGGGAKSKHIVNLHEYIVCYAKNKDKVGHLDLPPDEKALKYYKYKDDKHKERGPYRLQPLATNSMDERPNLRYPILFEGEEIWPEKQWQWSRERAETAQINDELLFTKKNGKWTVSYKQYLKSTEGEERRAKAYSIIDGIYIRAAFRTYWDDRGATRMEGYKNNVPGVPHVCVKVPTAGGKTFLAANALKPIFDVVVPESTGQPRVVVWLVPSLTILEQTERNFSDPTHPYRQRLNTHFKGRVEIYSKKSLLQGAGFSPDAIQGQLSLILMSFDSLRARNKDDRKIFQENGNLATFDVLDADWLPSADPTALINVIRALRPVVVVDESHNAESDLSVEMLVNLKPSFILDLTATPRNNSNIVSFVDALALKKECMVKLPVIVYNRPDKTEVVNNALQLRRKLEALAIAEEKITGKYIRPIILFQAEPKTGEEKETFQKIKATLVKLKISEAQIAIKTADVNELKGVDLMSRDCPVRYIITVNALKEGWDCPFAYILASLADKSSAVDVEQVVGRVLRQPHVVTHQEPLLNMSYVFTASNRFMDTLDKVVKGLNRAGFSDRDYRAIIEPVAEQKGAHTAHPDLFATPPPAVPEAPATTEYPTAEEEIDVERLQGCVADGGTMESESAGQPAVETDTTLEQLTTHAKEANQEFTEKAKDADSSLSPDLEARMNRYPIKSIYLEEARAIAIPQFFIQVPAGGFFDEAEKLALLEKENLLKDFRLSTCDTSLNFEGIDAEAYRVDLEQTGKDDYRPSFKKIDSRQKALLNAHILSLPRDSQVKNMAARLAEMIGNMYPIADREILAYIKRIMEGLTAEQLHDCLERDYSYVAKIKQKISELSTDYCEKVFGDWLTTEKIVTSPSFKLPEFIAPNLMGPTIANSLYMSEKKANGFEERVINDIANLPNIQFWHRNIEKSGFRINGFINHYPDFIIKTTSGKIIILETKGDDRDNSDSVRKLKLSNAWEKQAGRQFRYFMVFENKPIDGAHKLADALGLLGQL